MGQGGWDKGDGSPCPTFCPKKLINLEGFIKLL
mgnify:CR=1 FL=1